MKPRVNDFYVSYDPGTVRIYFIKSVQRLTGQDRTKSWPHEDLIFKVEAEWVGIFSDNGTSSFPSVPVDPTNGDLEDMQNNLTAPSNLIDGEMYQTFVKIVFGEWPSE